MKLKCVRLLIEIYSSPQNNYYNGIQQSAYLSQGVSEWVSE